MGEDICGWELSLKALCRFIRVGRKCSYIDECSHPRVRARRSDDRAAVRVPNQDYGTADPLQSPSHVGDILGVRIESVLRCDHLMSFGQKGRDEFAEARAVCPEAVDEDDAGFALICHNCAPFVQLRARSPDSGRRSHSWHARVVSETEVEVEGSETGVTPQSPAASPGRSATPSCRAV